MENIKQLTDRDKPIRALLQSASWSSAQIGLSKSVHIFRFGIYEMATGLELAKNLT